MAPLVRFHSCFCFSTRDAWHAPPPVLTGSENRAHARTRALSMLVRAQGVDGPAISGGLHVFSPTCSLGWPTGRVQALDHGMHSRAPQTFGPVCLCWAAGGDGTRVTDSAP